MKQVVSIAYRSNVGEQQRQGTYFKNVGFNHVYLSNDQETHLWDFKRTYGAAVGFYANKKGEIKVYDNAEYNDLTVNIIY